MKIKNLKKRYKLIGPRYGSIAFKKSYLTQVENN